MRLLVFLLATCLPFASVAEQMDRALICRNLSDELVAELSAEPHLKDYRLYRVEAFYSAKLDACIHVEEKLFGPEVMVRDMTRTVITDRTNLFPPLLLHCDAYGVDEANIEFVREKGGRVSDVPYEEWLTDGQGGLPRALKTPTTFYSRVDCEATLRRWLDIWR